MKYQISNFKVSPKDYKNLRSHLENKLHIKNFTYKVTGRSIDARDKSKVCFLYKVIIETDEPLKSPIAVPYTEKKYEMEYPLWNKKYRPVVVGFGPSGMFAALYLARCHADPIIIERGSEIEKRKERVEDFLKNKVLSPNSNVQYGEGGAGTFSDGKLSTNLKDPLIHFILNEFYLHGAKEDILYEAKPHIGTDYLEKIVKNIRLEIEGLGGTFYFDTIFTKMTEHEDSVTVEAEGEDKHSFTTDHVFLGIGHSAKDTIRYLYNELHISMEQKAFSMGVRIEHRREDINRAQYGDFAKYLPAAYYNLACHNREGRGVYTFCMCPGGYVIASQSDPKTIVVNGMSNNDRAGENSNSALLVDVRPSDYDKGGVLDGIDFQEHYEHLAYSVSEDYRAPANLVGEFMRDKVAEHERSIHTSYPHGLVFTDLRKVLPDFVIDNLKLGILEFDHKIRGFNNKDAIMIGIESRSSSPVRILRNEARKSSNPYIYPMGEGAGYAGGITSAALDGLKTAMMAVREEEHDRH